LNDIEPALVAETQSAPVSFPVKILQQDIAVEDG
jgi:hypothetical protein